VFIVVINALFIAHAAGRSLGADAPLRKHLNHGALAKIIATAT
jgi:hypothetical protein